MQFQLFAFRDVTGGGSISVATDGHSLKWLLPEPASPSQGKLRSGREETKPRAQVSPVLALWEHTCAAGLRLSGGKGVETQLTGLSGAL